MINILNIGKSSLSTNQKIMIDTVKRFCKEELKTRVINIMMHSDHYEKNQIKEIELKKNFINFDINWYRENIINKLTYVFNNGKIELDGHYNEEANEIIASEIANLINAFEKI